MRSSFNLKETEFSRYAFLWGIGPFFKHENNPILWPGPGAPHWASKAIFNPAAWSDGKNIHLFLRADGPVKPGSTKIISRIGHAVSDDGFDFNLRPETILEPTERYESAGYEDLYFKSILQNNIFLAHPFGRDMPQGYPLRMLRARQQEQSPLLPTAGRV